jgi:hypothetical protein
MGFPYRGHPVVREARTGDHRPITSSTDLRMRFLCRDRATGPVIGEPNTGGQQWPRVI